MEGEETKNQGDRWEGLHHHAKGQSAWAQVAVGRAVAQVGTSPILERGRHNPWERGAHMMQVRESTAETTLALVRLSEGKEVAVEEAVPMKATAVL